MSSTTYPPGQTGPPARTPATFAFTPPTDRTEDPASYVYSLNTPPPATLPHGPTLFPTAVVVPAQPNGAATTVTITPRRADTNTLYVYAVDTAGNPSATTTYPFHTAGITTPDPAGDLTGDGVPDALAVGTVSLPGLWLFAGTDKAGHVNSATQVGATAPVDQAPLTPPATGPAPPSLPPTSPRRHPRPTRQAPPRRQHRQRRGPPGLGDGTTATPDPATIKALYLPKVDNTPGSQSVDQIVAAPGPSVTGLALPDLYAIIGDTLYLYTPLLPPATAYDNPQPLSTGWSNRTITATAVGDTPALFARDNTTGELDLYTADLTNPDAPVPPGGPASTKTVYATSGFKATTVPTITGADLDVDGRPDLWTITSDGKLNAYRNNGANHLAAPVTSPLAPTGPFHSGIFNKCLDATDTLANAGHPVQIRDCANSSAQTWTTPGDGTVRVNNQCLDISYERTDNGSQVSLYNCIPGARAQQWTRTTLGALRNPYSGRCLDVDGAGNSGVNGTGVQIWDCNGSPQQAFTLNQAVGMFRSGVNGKCLDNLHGLSTNSNPIVIYGCNGGVAQLWSTPGDGTVRISGKCLDVAGGATTSGAKIQLFDCTGAASQQWQAGPSYSLVNVNSGLCVDDPNGTSTDLTQVSLYFCVNTSAQVWGLHLSISGPIRSILPVKCVDDRGNGAGLGNPVQLRDCNGSLAQQWTAVGDGTVRINGMCLDITNAATDNFARVQLYTCVGNGAQQWISGPNNSIVNPVSGRCLDDPYGAPTNGNQLWIYDCNGGDAQNWTLPY